MGLIEQLLIKINAQDNASSALNKLQNNIRNVGAAWLSWEGAKKILSATISEAAESERVWTGVAGAVKNVGENTRQVTPILQEYANTFITRFGIADEVVGDVMQRMMQLGLSSSEAMHNVGIALDFATRRGIDYATAADYIAKAHSGNVTMLEKLGFQFTKGATDALRYQEALQQMARLGLGALEDEAKTTEGAWRTFTENLKEMLEDIGTSVLPKLNERLVLANKKAEALKYLTSGALPSDYGDVRSKLLNGMDVESAALDDIIAEGRKYTDVMIAAKKALADFAVPNSKIPKDFQDQAKEIQRLVDLYPKLVKYGYYYGDTLDEIKKLTEEWNKITNKQSAEAQAAAAKIAKMTIAMTGLTDKFREQDTELENTTTGWLAYMKVIQSGGEISAAAGKSIDEAFNATLQEAIENTADALERAEAAYQKILHENDTIKNGKTSSVVAITPPVLPDSSPYSIASINKWMEKYGFDYIDKNNKQTEVDDLQEKLDELKETAIGGAMWESFNNATARAADMMTRAFMGEKVKFKELWQSMAADFLKFFLQEMLKEIAIWAAKAIVKMALFDNPKNDAIAFKSGQDYMKHTERGIDSVKLDVNKYFSLSPALAGAGTTNNQTHIFVLGGNGRTDKRLLARQISSIANDRKMPFETRRSILNSLRSLETYGA
jgi:hypothetical protein